MKYSVFTVCMPEFTVDEAIEKLVEWGYEGVDWRVTNQEPSADGKPGFWAGNRCTITLDEVLGKAKEIGGRCRDAGLEVASIASYLKCDQLPEVERVFEAANLMGTDRVRIGVPLCDGSVNYRRLFDRAVSEYAEVEKLARRHRLKALVETHMDTVVPSASAAYRLVGGFDPAHVGVIYDPGNMVVEGFENARLGLELLGEYLAAVHVKNMRWEKGGIGSHGRQLWKSSTVELREGMVDWAEVVRTLKAVGYDGWMSMEDFSTARHSAEKLPDDLAYLKSLY
jgi:sugar phosphate isomerase/epimerase